MIFEALFFTFKKIIKNYGAVVLILALFVLSQLALGPLLEFWGLPTIISTAIVSSIGGLTLIVFALKWFEDEKVNLDYFVEFFTPKTFIYAVILYAIIGVIVLVPLFLAIIPILGLIVGIILTIIISTKSSMAIYILIEEKLNPIEALKKSFEMTKGKAWELFYNSLGLQIFFVIGYFGQLKLKSLIFDYETNYLNEILTEVMIEKTFTIQLYDVAFESLGLMIWTLTFFYFYKRIKEPVIESA